MAQGQAGPPGRAVAVQHPVADLIQEADQFPGHPAFVQFRQFIEDAGINQEDQGDGVGLGGVAAQPRDLGGNLVLGGEVDAHRGLVETPILAKPLQQAFKHEFASLVADGVALGPAPREPAVP